MTEEEIEKKAEEYALEYVCKNCELCHELNPLCSSVENYIKAFKDGYEVGKKNERELQCGKTHRRSKGKIHSLETENEALMKSALVWHKVTLFDEPDENNCITADAPCEIGKQYLVRLKRGGYAVQTLDEDEHEGFIFEDYGWDEIEAWAELPEATVCLM